VGIRVFDIKDIARCAGAMFFDRPDLATRYPNQLIYELKDDIFSPANEEDIYYTSAYAYYRLILHFNNNRVANSYRKYKWYLLMLIKYVAIDALKGKKQTQTAICAQIKKLMQSNDEENIKLLESCTRVLESLEPISNDRMKRHGLVGDVKAKYHTTP